jgi:hypothetical protein
MLEVSRGAVAAEEKYLVSFAAEWSKYCSICTVTLDPYGGLSFTSRGHWQCLRGGADSLNGSYAACGCGTEYRCGALLGGGGRVATSLRRWRALPLRSPARRWRVLPLAEIEPFHSSPIYRLLISVSAFNFRVEEDWERKGVKFQSPDRITLRSALQQTRSAAWVPALGD